MYTDFQFLKDDIDTLIQKHKLKHQIKVCYHQKPVEDYFKNLAHNKAVIKRSIFLWVYKSYFSREKAEEFSRNFIKMGLVEPNHEAQFWFDKIAQLRQELRMVEGNV